MNFLQVKVNMLGRLQVESQVELPPALRFGGASQDALLPSPTGMISVLDRAFKGEL